MSQAKQNITTKTAVNTKIKQRRGIATGKLQIDLVVRKSSSHPPSENIFYTL